MIKHQQFHARALLKFWLHTSNFLADKNRSSLFIAKRADHNYLRIAYISMIVKYLSPSFLAVPDANSNDIAIRIYFVTQNIRACCKGNDQFTSSRIIAHGPSGGG
jgi:hypothetical protein